MIEGMRGTLLHFLYTLIDALSYCSGALIMGRLLGDMIVHVARGKLAVPSKHRPL